MNESMFSKISEFFDYSFEFGVHRVDKIKSVVREVKAEDKFLRFLRAENCKGCDIYMRPAEENSGYFMLVDDLNVAQVREYQNKPGLMIVETSPANYQVWIHTAKLLSNKEKTLLLRQYGGDPNAAPNKRWGRAPGFTNRKPKRLKSDGLYPFARLHYIDYGFADIQVPDDMSQQLIGANVSRDASSVSCGDSRGISRKDYETGDPSRTDFRFAMALIKSGATKSEVRERLLVERIDWNNHSGGNRIEHYLSTTIDKAWRWTK